MASLVERRLPLNAEIQIRALKMADSERTELRNQVFAILDSRASGTSDHASRKTALELMIKSVSYLEGVSQAVSLTLDQLVAEAQRPLEEPNAINEIVRRVSLDIIGAEVDVEIPLSLSLMNFREKAEKDYNIYQAILKKGVAEVDSMESGNLLLKIAQAIKGCSLIAFINVSSYAKAKETFEALPKEIKSKLERYSLPALSHVNLESENEFEKLALKIQILHTLEMQRFALLLGPKRNEDPESLHERAQSIFEVVMKDRSEEDRLRFKTFLFAVQPAFVVNWRLKSADEELTIWSERVQKLI